MKDNLLYSDEVYAIQGAVFAVYKEMGNAWSEEVYHQCLEKELALRGIPFDTKKALRIYYKGEPIEKTYISDFVCYDKIILELIPTTFSWSRRRRSKTPTCILNRDMR